MASEPRQKSRGGQVLSTCGVFAMLSGLSLALGACGAKSGDKKDKDAPPAAPAAQQDAGGSPAPAPAPDAPQSFDLTATYKMRPVDIVIIRGGETRQDPFNSRLAVTWPVLAAKIWNLASITGSVHVGVFDHYFKPNPTATPPPLNTGTPIVGATLPSDKVLAAESLSADDFGKALQERLTLAGGRGGSSMPGQTLAAIIAESKKADGGDAAGLFRPDAFLAVVYLSVNSTVDPFAVEDILALLKDHTAGYAISALAPEKDGCTIADTSPPKSTNPNKDMLQSLELKLQQATSGVFGTVCDKTYVLFFDTFSNNGTGTQYFPVTLPAPIKTVVKIVAGDVEIKDYRFIPGSTTLEVSTNVASGQKFTVTATVEGAVVQPVVSSAQGDDVPAAGNTQLSPEETDFLTKVQPKFVQYCSTCHNGRPFNTQGAYKSAVAYKTEIARRIALPDTDAQMMPQKGSPPLSAGDKQIILDWATK